MNHSSRLEQLIQRHEHAPGSHDCVTFAVQDGGARGHVTLAMLELRVLISKYCRGPYSPDVREFAFLVRLDGEFVQWNFEGCERLRRSFKDQFIQIDLGIPLRRWEYVPDKELRNYLMGCVLAGANAWIERLRRDKVQMDEQAFLRDFDHVKVAFLANSHAD